MMNYLEIFNELCILAASYHLLLFTDYISDPTMQQNVGWSIIGVTTFNIIVNMICMLIVSFGKFKLHFLKIR